MSLRDILARLGDYGLKRAGDGKWQSRCPAHKDGTPSLSIGIGLGGRVLANCFAGCTAAQVVESIGLTESDLFEDAKDAIKETLDPGKWPVTATYVYDDAHGDPVYRVLRKTSPDSGKKTFRQERAAGTTWIGGAGAMDNVPRVLYRLPRILESDVTTPILVVEGEKDADNLTSVGFVATTNAGGAGKWQTSYSEALRGRAVVILPDNDKPGQAHAEAVAKALEGIAASVKTVKLPVGEKGDVSDWIKAGHDAKELELLIATGGVSRQSFVSSADRLIGERFERLDMGRDVLSFGVKFLDDALGGIIPRDLVIIGAKTGTGKTALATIAALSNCKAGKRVHYFALEAEDREIERRMKFQVLAAIYYKDAGQHRRIRFLDWYQGKLDIELGKYEEQADAEVAEMTKNLHTYYRIDSFTTDDFCQQLESIKGETDLVVLDHLHYVDNDDNNENRGYKKMVKQIRDNALRCQKPVIVVAHVRKSDRRLAQLLPDIEDFHGSSDVPKMATKAIMLAPDFATNTMDPSMWSTFMQIGKCRADSSLTRYVARLDFNTRTDAYEPAYSLGKLIDGGKTFEAIAAYNWPSWKGNASSGQQSESYVDGKDGLL